MDNAEARSRNHFCSGKAISTTYSECVSVTFVIQRAVRMHHIVICGLSGSTIVFHIISYKMCALISLQLLSEIVLILRRTERDIIRNVYRSLCKVPVILV